MTSYVSKHLRVFLLDDHDIVRRGLSDLMSAKRDITVVGDSDSAKQAAKRILELKPDVMVLDVHLQDGTGVDVCREVRSLDPSIRGLMLTASADEEALVLALLAGAAGYVIKMARSFDIIEAVRRVGAGDSMIDQATVERVAGNLLTNVRGVPRRLSEREEQTLTHVLAGRTNTQIAQQLGISVDEAGSEITALIEKVVKSTPWMTPLSVEPGFGRHRRTDS